MKILNNKDIIEIYSNTCNGPYSKMSTFMSINETLKQLGLKEFNNDKENLSVQELQIIDNVINVLIHKISKK